MKVKLLSEATCVRCHKTIGKGRSAISEKHGLSFFYYHPSCHKAGHVMHHGRYVRKSSITQLR